LKSSIYKAETVAQHRPTEFDGLVDADAMVKAAIVDRLALSRPALPSAPAKKSTSIRPVRIWPSHLSVPIGSWRGTIKCRTLGNGDKVQTWCARTWID
jgi:hypothetical protein